MKASTIIKVASAVVAVAAAGVAIYNKTKAEKIHEEFVNANEDNVDEFTAEAVKEKVDEIDEALNVSDVAFRIAIGAACVFAGAVVGDALYRYKLIDMRHDAETAKTFILENYRHAINDGNIPNLTKSSENVDEMAAIALEVEKTIIDKYAGMVDNPNEFKNAVYKLGSCGVAVGITSTVNWLDMVVSDCDTILSNNAPKAAM